METNEKLVEVLNDLIEINNDRIVGYEKAVNELSDTDADLKAVFTSMAGESRKYASELATEVTKLGGEVAEGTTNLGHIYRAWMSIKQTFTGTDRHSVLESCEGGEDAAQKAYREALASDAEIPADIRQLITDQKASLKNSHDQIKAYRDAHETVS